LSSPAIVTQHYGSRLRCWSSPYTIAIRTTQCNRPFALHTTCRRTQVPETDSSAREALNSYKVATANAPFSLAHVRRRKKTQLSNRKASLEHVLYIRVVHNFKNLAANSPSSERDTTCAVSLPPESVAHSSHCSRDEVTDKGAGIAQMNGLANAPITCGRKEERNGKLGVCVSLTRSRRRRILDTYSVECTRIAFPFVQLTCPGSPVKLGCWCRCPTWGLLAAHRSLSPGSPAHSFNHLRDHHNVESGL